LDFRTSIQTMISRISTMKPRTPPPVPNFHALPWLWVVSVSSAMARERREKLRRRVRVDWNAIVAVVCW